MFIRLCPTCAKEISYLNKKSYNRASKNNSNCKKCGGIERGKKLSIMYAGRSLTEVTKKRISNSMAGRKLSDDWKQKIGKSNKGKHSISDIHKEKLRQANIGRTSFWKGKKRLPEVGEKIRRSKLGKPSPRRGIPLSDESKLKMRLAAINRMRILGSSFTFVPSYNKLACKIFDYINKEMNWKGTHAENGGEFHIKELGYWVDYYEPNLNIVIEFDEDFHKYNIDKDATREKEIKNHLKCRLIRINKDTDILQLLENIKI